jgi:hypothetical protein
MVLFFFATEWRFLRDIHLRLRKASQSVHIIHFISGYKKSSAAANQDKTFNLNHQSQHECSWNLVSHPIRLIKKHFEMLGWKWREKVWNGGKRSFVFCKVRYDLCISGDVLLSTWIERKLRLWNSFDSTNSLFPNRNFSSNEWMTEFLFCSAFKTPCKQASMQTSLCLYLNDLWSECFCLVMAVRLRVFVVFWKGSWEDFLYCKSKISILCNDDGWTWISVFSFFVL